MIIATAGHVDHGKSTVVRLLTGVDPDRWEEEQRRGLTIGLGYGFFALAGAAPGSAPDVGADPDEHGETERVVAVVDVPGHGRFLPTMLAGVHAVDVALLVVAADEGWMPQTAEHVAVLHALGTPTGVVVLTHVDRVDATRVEDLRCELGQRLAGTFLGGVATRRDRVVALDGLTGAGSGDLRDALAHAAAELRADRRWAAARDSGRPRLWVDRSFSLSGIGRVATGTLTGGALGVDDDVELVSGSPSGTPGKTHVQSLHVDASAGSHGAPGHRVGLRVGDRSMVPEVGDAFVAPGQWQAGRHLHAAVQAFDPTERVGQRRGYDLVVGTRRWTVELRRSPRVTGPLRPRARSSPGDAGGRTDQTAQSPSTHQPVRPAAGWEPVRPAATWEPVRLHAAEAVVPVAPGDRFVLVDTATSRAVAGGMLLAVDSAVVRRDQQSLERRLDALLAGDPALMAAALVAETGPGLPVEEVLGVLGHVPDCLDLGVDDGSAVDRPSMDRRVAELSALLEADAADGSQSPGLVLQGDPLDRHAAAVLIHLGLAVDHGGRLWRSEAHRLAASDTAGRELQRVAGARVWRRQELVAAVVAAGLPSSAVTERLRSGELVELGTGTPAPAGPVGARSAGSARIVSAPALEQFRTTVLEQLSRSPAGLGQLRDALGLSRNDTLSVLEHLDACGVTRREGDVRVRGGDRLPGDGATKPDSSAP